MPQYTTHTPAQPARFVAVMPLTMAEEHSFSAGSASTGAAQLGQGARSYLGRRLRQGYQELTQQPLPTHMLAVLDKISRVM